MTRVCVLTGASGVLGKAFIERYATRYSIVAVYNRHDLSLTTLGQSYVDPLAPSAPAERTQYPIFTIQADLSRAEAINGLCTHIIEQHQRVDLLINGAAHRHWCNLLRPDSLSDLELTFRVNVMAPLQLTVALARSFWQFHPEENVRERRNVVNVSSTAGVYAYPDLGQTCYAASKAALNHATYHLASELWDVGVRVNAVAPNSFPGIIATERVIDQIVAFDESDDTGRVAVIDA
jgi:NAD(P)-dependent dehydrogenase (short-subunit alcohol dehydrogenase family)